MPHSESQRAEKAVEREGNSDTNTDTLGEVP